MELLKIFSIDQSLGSAYGNLINLIGFQQFDEYKVMGLAPYGDPARYKSAFSSLYTLLPEGDYAFNYQNWEALYTSMRPRKKSEEITQHHKDLAAALQSALEEIVFHVLTHYQKKTRQRNLCLAGGVAHNCTLNGKILYSGLFSNIFVQPAAHDAGCALGAALSVYLKMNPRGKVSPLKHLYWGTDIGNEREVMKSLAGWKNIITIEKADAICQRVAGLIADGSVIGWVQGRSEFGPRALGNRSILADPRPAENKQIINAMVKKREGFRPFAPSILEEDLKEYYDINGSREDFSFMNYVVKVRPEKRQLLGAVTHVDGTARIQKVSRETNRKYWDLISAFKAATGVPILLNTSFNNNAEPIVDSVEDAVACFLTAKVHYLVVGDFLISKTDNLHGYLELIPSLPGHVVMMQVKRAGADGTATVFHEIKNNVDPSFRLGLSPEVFDLLVRANGQETLEDLLRSSAVAKKRTLDDLLSEIQDLWSRRVIRLKPSPAGAGSRELK